MPRARRLALVLAVAGVGLALGALAALWTRPDDGPVAPIELDRPAASSTTDPPTTTRPPTTTTSTTTTTAPPTTTTLPVPAATTPFEAEAGTIGTGMAVAADATASGGSYVVAQSAGGTARYTVSVPSRGTYMVAGWVKAPSSSADAFTVRLDSGSAAEWRLTQSRSWTYDGSSNPTFSLSAGTHTLTVGYREAGAAVDRLVLVRR